MASFYIRAENTGAGFITREDRLKFTISGKVEDIYEVSGEYEEWVARVGGVIISEEEVNEIIANLPPISIIP